MTELHINQLKPSVKTPFQELYDQGVDRYLGVFTPSNSEVVSRGVTEHFFSGMDAPVCYTGNQFSMFTREGSSNNLLIFLQGGGFCGPIDCNAIETGIPLVSFGMLNASDAENPLANFDVGYVPYCDGSGFMGDIEVDSDGDGTNDRFFKGIQNLSASLDVIAQSYPYPDKIVLAGNSAGGFGVHAALPLVRKLYPEVRIHVINDSGVGILDPNRMQELVNYWNAGSFFPASCSHCIGDDGNITDYHSYQLSEDSNIRMAFISSKQDAKFAVNITGGGAAFEAQLIEAASELNNSFPERFHSLIADGDEHTFILKKYDNPIGGTTVRQWIDNMVNDSEDWVSLIGAEERVIGFEIQQFVSPTEIIIWTSADITLEEYEALELPQGWMTTPPKEFDPDEGGHTRSPGAANDGDYTYGNFFGFDWLHNATVIEFGISMDSEGLLSGAYVSKHQEVTYYAGKVLHVIVSPEGDYYIRLIRDAFRSTEEPSIPVDWQKIEYVLPEDITVRFPNPTLAIFADNGDSFQGPLSAELLGLDEDVNTPEILITESGVEFVRTPASRFENLPNWPYAYQYVEIDDLRQAYAEAGPADGPVVLLLHGQPSWSYLYRKMIPVLAEAGYRVIAMDHLGMGRSDKPIDIKDYSYIGHAERLERFIEALNLSDINLFVQDWGSLIGLRVAGLNPEWFATISVGNGDLFVIPEGFEPFPPVENPNEVLDLPYPFAFFPDQQITLLYDGCDLIFDGGGQQEGFGNWIEYSMKGASFQPSQVVESLTWFPLPADVKATYDAPFPTRDYMAGVRVFPSLINQIPGVNDVAWAGLTSYEKPFLTIWGSNDVGTLGNCETQQKLIDNVPGATGQPHDRLPEAGHFLQSDQGEEIAMRLVDFYQTNGITVPENALGFEILELKSANEIFVWVNNEITEQEFNAIELPGGWFKNQTRESDATTSRFLRSPDASVDGPLEEVEHPNEFLQYVLHSIKDADRYLQS